MRNDNLESSAKFIKLCKMFVWKNKVKFLVDCQGVKFFLNLQEVKFFLDVNKFLLRCLGDKTSISSSDKWLLFVFYYKGKGFGEKLM